MFQSFSPFGQLQGLGAFPQVPVFPLQQQQFFPRPPRASPAPVPIAVPAIPVVNPVVSGTFVFTQTIPLATWTIDYPFLGQFPSVTLTDLSGNVVLADVQYIVGQNRVIVTFADPFAGIAYLNV